MNRYIINSESGKRIIFAKPYEGLCEICEKPGGWGNEKNICAKAGEIFSLGVDKRNFIHIVGVSKKNELIYLKGRDGVWQEAIIAQGMQEIGRLEIAVSHSRKDMLYSTFYENEWILVHCVLGNGARPNKIAGLCEKDFSVFGDRVYFSDSDENICYMDFSDGKPVNRVKLHKGRMPYVTNEESDIYIAYKNDNALFVNGERFVNDLSAEMPVIVKNNDDFILMWRSGDFVKYADFKSKKIRHIAIGAKPDIIICAEYSGRNSYYGNFTNNTLKVYPNINLFPPKDKFAENREEIQKLKKLLEEQNAKIESYRNEINKLNNIIYEMSKNRS